MKDSPYCWICGNYVEEAEDKVEQSRLLDIKYNPDSGVLVQTIQVTMVFCPLCSSLEHVQRHMKKARPKTDTKPKRIKKPTASKEDSTT